MITAHGGRSDSHKCACRVATPTVIGWEGPQYEGAPATHRLVALQRLHVDPAALTVLPSSSKDKLVVSRAGSWQGRREPSLGGRDGADSDGRCAQQLAQADREFRDVLEGVLCLGQSRARAAEGPSAQVLPCDLERGRGSVPEA